MCNPTSSTMFNNKFQITSLITIVFAALSMVILSFLIYEMERSANHTYIETSTEEWAIKIGIFSVSFIIALGLFFRIDLIRKFIQLVAILVSLGFTGFIFSDLSRRGFGISQRDMVNVFPKIGLAIFVLSFMLGLFGLMGNEVVKGEFRERDTHS